MNMDIYSVWYYIQGKSRPLKVKIELESPRPGDL